MPVVSVVFDVGETLLNDTREYGTWADWIGVPRHTFSAVFGVVTAAGQDIEETFRYSDPASTWRPSASAVSRQELARHTTTPTCTSDVRPALRKLREMGLWVGIAGNQTAKAGRILRAMRLPADLVATSDDWGVAKPGQAFFQRIAEIAPAARRDRLRRRPSRQRRDPRQDGRPSRRPHTPRPWGHLWPTTPASPKMPTGASPPSWTCPPCLRADSGLA